MKRKEKMVLSTEKKSKTTTDIPKQSRKLNSSSATKKCVKKEPKERILISLTDPSEDFNDSVDFISPLNKRKLLKNEKSLGKLSSADNKKSKKQTNPRSLSASSAEPPPMSANTTLTCRRTRSSERKIQAEERRRESLTDNSDLSKSSPVLPSISKVTLRENSASKPGKCSFKELKKQTASKLSKVKVETPEKDEKPRRTPAKKLVKSELIESNVRSSSSTAKGDTVPSKDKTSNKRRTYRPRSKSLENSDTLNLLEKSSPKVDTPVRKQTKKENLDSSKTPVKLEKLSGKKSQNSPKQDRSPSKYVLTKNKDQERSVCEFIDSSPILAAADKSTPNSQSSTGDKEINNDNRAVSCCQNATVKCPTCKKLIQKKVLAGTF